MRRPLFFRKLTGHVRFSLEPGDKQGVLSSSYRSILNAVTGLQFDVDAMMTAGERNYVLRKIMELRTVTLEEDDLPLRLKEPLVGGPAGETIPGRIAEGH